MVTSHSQALSGLSANTLYHYRVKSKDADGNLATSGDYTCTTSAAPDTTPPTISNVASSGITSSGATITWTTDEASDSQVDYGTTTSYGSSTILNATMETSHSEALVGLTASTTYHYRVKSKDADGNLATSGDYTFTTSEALDTTPPVISSVLVTQISTTSAVISWKTDKPANSKVEYGRTIAYSNSADLEAMTTDHSLSLRRLNPGAQYHFRVLSTDGNGNQSSSEDFSFATIDKGLTERTLVVPRNSAGQWEMASALNPYISQASASTYEYLGFALINMDSETATLTFTAMDSYGNVITGPDIVNPAFDELGPGEQIGVLDFQIFGSGLSNSHSVGYIRVESTADRITGLFTIFDSDLDSNLSMLDGTNLGAEPLTTFVFPEIESGNYTKVNISNNNPDSVNLTFELVGADGTVRTSAQKTIAANGAIVADLLHEIFRGVTPDRTEYVRVRASQGVQAFELLRKSTGDIAALIGQDADGGATKLYSPQFAMGDIYRSSVSIVNLDSAAGVASIRFIGQDASQIGVTKVVYLAPYQKILIDDPHFFRELDLDVLTQGYLEITGYGIKLAGSVVFGESSGTTFSTALPLVSKLQQSVLFSHVASNDIFYTGYAIVNPNGATAIATIDLFAADGSLVGTTISEIPAWHRETRLLTEYFPFATDQDIRSGYVRITVNMPVAAYSIYGTSNFSVISAIPTQEIP